MTNVEKLETISSQYLGEIRQRLGASDENDTSQDDTINKMSNHKLVGVWCAWNLGESDWWYEMKDLFDELEGLSK